MTTKFDIIKLKVLSALGNAEAIYLLACYYLYGIQVSRDKDLAYQLLSKSSEKGFKPANLALSTVFADNGKSNELDKGFAKIYDMFCETAREADKGNPIALHLKSAGKLSDETDDYLFFRAVKDMKKAAEQDYAPALYSLGFVYLKGNRISGKRAKGVRMIRAAALQEYAPAILTYCRINPGEAVPMLVKLTEKEDAPVEAYSMLGQSYLQGIGVVQNNEKGMRLLTNAAEKGDEDAICSLGVIYQYGLNGVAIDIPKAVSYYERGIQNEDSDCMLNLGYILEQSDKWPHDYKRAFELYKKSAELGNARAYNNLGTCYKRGIGTTVDAQEALKCYELAIKGGEKATAYMNLYVYYMDGICCQKDVGKAIEWLKKGDADGVLQCSYQLSGHYKNGYGVPIDNKKMFTCLLKSAKGGLEEAFLELGHCYSNAIGTHKNDRRAVECYKIAAESGNAQAQYELGICYRQGEGVPQDILKAIDWYQKAIEQGHGGAMCNLGILYDNGIGLEKDKEKALHYYRMSAEAGNRDGQFCLASKYFQGDGIEQNYQEAVKWFMAAANQGEPDSLFHLAICYYDGLGVEEDARLAGKYIYMAADRGWKPAIDTINEYRIPRPSDDN